ncbi:unnamed protein product [Durusdinium trenchii]|uniref:Uncharacterized protein n=2 Tax=Durusdinium trenchii TaxID=1381693 RepID=A0ABP0KYW9_9DINO
MATRWVLRCWVLQLFYGRPRAELNLNMNAFCQQTPLPLICPSSGPQYSAAGACAQNPDSCCKQSSCIAFGTMPLPMIGGCRPDRGPTRCADMTTPFGGMGVCQCAQGICASNGVCMDNSFLGLGGLMGANKNFDESQQLQAPPPGGYQPAMYPSSGTPMPMQMPFFGRLYQASEHVVPPEDHSPVLLGLGSFACAFLALVGLMTRRCGFRQASHHYRVLSSEAVDEDVALSDS